METSKNTENRKGNVPDHIWKDFADTGKLPESTLYSIAKKIITGKNLDERELSISQDKIKEINELMAEIREEEDIQKKRGAYINEYKRVMDIKEEGESNLKKIKRKVFGHKYKEEDFPEHLVKLEEEYNSSLAKKGNRMYSKKKEELGKQKISEEEIKLKLEEYINKSIYDEIIVNEQKKLSEAKTENLPPKEKSMFKKGIDWYLKQSRVRRIMISATLSTLVFATFMPGTVVAAGGIAAFAGTKLVRATISTLVGQTASKMYDFLLTDKTKEKRSKEESDLKKEFSQTLTSNNRERNTGENIITKEGIKNLTTKYKEIGEREQQRKRNRVIHKALVTAIAGGTTAIASGHIFSGGGNTHDLENIQKENIESDQLYVEKTEPVSQIEENELLENVNREPATIAQVEFSSRGSIQTLNDLKHELLVKYPDISKAPHSVQEFLKTNSTEEAIKLGLFDPSSQEESALIAEGSSLEFDENGNLIFEDANTGESYSLINESGEIETIEKYQGKMFDSDHINEREDFTDRQNNMSYHEPEEIKTEKTFLREEDMPYEGNTKISPTLEESDFPYEEEIKPQGTYYKYPTEGEIIKPGKGPYYKYPGPEEITETKGKVYYKYPGPEETNVPQKGVYYSYKGEQILEPEVIVRYQGDTANKVLQRIIEGNPRLAESLGWTKESTLQNFAISESSGSGVLLRSPEIVSRLYSNEILEIFKYDVVRSIWTPEKLSEEAYRVLLDKHFGHYEFNNYVHGINTDEWMDIRKIKAENLFNEKVEKIDPKYNNFIEETRRLSKETGLVPKTEDKEHWEEFYKRMIKYKLTH